MHALLQKYAGMIDWHTLTEFYKARPPAGKRYALVYSQDR